MINLSFENKILYSKLDKEGLIFNKNNTFYINLDRRTDRRDKMEKQFDFFNIEATRWKACEPNNITSLFIDNLTESQKSCGQSHINIWKYIVDNNIEYALILEDDISFDYKWKEKLKQFDFPYFSLIYLGTLSFNDINKWHNHRNCILCSSYIISKNLANLLVELSYVIKFTNIDFVLHSFQKYNNVYSYTFFPYLSIQNSYDSDVEGSKPILAFNNIKKQLNLFNYSINNYYGFSNT